MPSEIAGLGKLSTALDRDVTPVLLARVYLHELEALLLFITKDSLDHACHWKNNILLLVVLHLESNFHAAHLLHL